MRITLWLRCLCRSATAFWATRDAELSDIRTVLAHPQALMQSSQYLNAREDWRQLSVENNAVAARKVSEEADKSQAAVASRTAAEIYGLKVLAEGINHNRENTTRFLSSLKTSGFTGRMRTRSASALSFLTRAERSTTC